MPAKAAVKSAARPVARPTRPVGLHVRTPNAERSATTRAKLLEATIACLHEQGYHQTSTVLVTERAKVSRGAMLHHFPTKADLMIAVSQHIVELRRDLHNRRLAQLKTDREKFLHLIDILWAAFETPSGIARIEIMLGSRSDPELGPRFSELNDMLDERHKQFVWAHAQKLGVKARDKRKLRAFVQLYAAALRGLAIDSLWPGSRIEIRASLALLKEFQVRMLDDMLAG